MTASRSTKLPPQPWSVPVALDDIAEIGQHFDLVAEGTTRAAVARTAGLRELPRLEASFDVTRHGAGGLHVAGKVSATVGQTCVVTLEPLVNDLEEAVDLVFLPAAGGSEQPNKAEVRDGPEPLVDGKVDLGAIATEFLMLGLDPYPRRPDAVFQPPPGEEPVPGPFAALAGLKDGLDRDRG
jgi:uncharacterized metal-binding protein YceD (DUF177 family)